MPVGLLDLPREVLDACIGELMPPLREHGPEWIVDCDTFLGTFPADILALRLACSLLYHLATPWVWRRLAIRLDKPILERTRPSQNLPIALLNWTPLFDRPEVVKHVRFFSLCSSGLRYAELRPAFAALIPLVRMMTKLRVVRLQVIPLVMDATAETKHIFSTLFADLLSKPKLHTSIVRCTLQFRILALRSLANVKRLSISDHFWLERILPMTPQLEVLSFDSLDEDSDASRLSIPWNTLRELDTRDVGIWTHILDNYTAWKERNPTEHSPLSELFMSGVLLDSDGLCRIISGFSELKLTKLNLRGIIFVDTSIFRSLLFTFPHLEALNLFTGICNLPWETELSEISEIFGQCPLLKVFRCSYTSGQGYILPHFDEEEGVYIPDSDEEQEIFQAPPVRSVRPETLMAKFAKIAVSLGKGTQSLNHIQFFDRYDDSYPFEIERDGQGDYKATYSVVSYGLINRIKCLHTSSWRLDDFNYL